MTKCLGGREDSNNGINAPDTIQISYLCILLTMIFILLTQLSNLARTSINKRQKCFNLNPLAYLTSYVGINALFYTLLVDCQFLININEYLRIVEGLEFNNSGSGNNDFLIMKGSKSILWIKENISYHIQELGKIHNNSSSGNTNNMSNYLPIFKFLTWPFFHNDSSYATTKTIHNIPLLLNNINCTNNAISDPYQSVIKALDVLTFAKKIIKKEISIVFGFFFSFIIIYILNYLVSVMNSCDITEDLEEQGDENENVLCCTNHDTNFMFILKDLEQDNSML
ncbi:uncharacterized protein SCDLUD_002969 [Saccharomycodes ludwigii]|uniref:uncharacterized protein n=1 Tax=Saccharomycodes ludwigii TaxID=36035 RepID=UPI001E847ABE|nr:hypothetical protein SCDLUD_002969 [Saccharomycodes ludwigii]KAH3901474.1 hypothetical protein SCDLUD_002969 [Saccharomycodes ludwigii]